MVFQKKSDMSLILLIGSLLLWIVYRFWMKETPMPQKVIQVILPEAGLNDLNVKFWIAVSAHETAYSNNYQNPWSSPVFEGGRNLFGMREAGSNTTAIGTYLGHAKYNSISDSAQDLVLYFNRLKWNVRNFSTIPELVSEMKRKGYFTAPLADYQKGVEYWFNKLQL